MITVISQSMYFPWLGVFDQIRICDQYIHYDDVQLSRGFYNRVQVMDSFKSSYMSVPLLDKKQKQLIIDTKVMHASSWKEKHRAKLMASIQRGQYRQISLEIFDKVHQIQSDFLIDYNRKSISGISSFLGMDNTTEFMDSTEFHPEGKSSYRLLDICKKTNTKVYLTGHGALNYLDHELFEQNGIEVFYMKYDFVPYSVEGRIYTPFVTALDPIAHLGSRVTETMQSKMVYWREAVKDPISLRPKYVNAD